MTPAPGDSTLDTAFVGVILVAGGASGVVWVGAALAAAVSGGGMLPASVADGLRAALRLPSTVGEPAAAWPPAAAAELPGATLYWLCTAVVLAVVVAVTAMALGNFGGGERAGRSRRSRLGVEAGARLARPADLAPLIVKRPTPGRFVVGTVGRRRRLVATEDRTRPTRGRRAARRQGDRGAVALVGPARCGKTATAVAGILEWTGPAVLSSVKADLLGATMGWRSEVGECRVYDPTGSTGERGAGWSPLRDAGTITGAQRAARALCDAAPRSGVEGGADFWLAQSEILLCGLFWVAHHHNKGMAEVVEWILTADRPSDVAAGQVELLLEAATASPDPQTSAAAWEASRFLHGIWGMDDRTRSSVYATAQTVVWPWADPALAASARADDLHLDWLLSASNTVYLCAPIEDQRRLAPAFGGLLNDLIRQAYRRVALTRQPLDPPLLVVIDEAANTPLRALPEYASTLAGIGVLLVTVWQSVAQLHAEYRRSADTILTNHLTKVLFSGLSDQTSLGFAALVAGDEEAEMRSRTGGGGGRGRSVVSVSRAPLVPAHVLRQMAPGDALLLHGTLPPAHLRARLYWQIPQLAARAALVSEPAAGLDQPEEGDAHAA